MFFLRRLADEFFGIPIPSFPVQTIYQVKPLGTVCNHEIGIFKKFLCSCHKTKYNEHLLKKLGEMEEYFARKNVANCQIFILRNYVTKLIKLKTNKIS